jgi:hypothetical protein
MHLAPPAKSRLRGALYSAYEKQSTSGVAQAKEVNDDQYKFHSFG